MSSVRPSSPKVPDVLTHGQLGARPVHESLTTGLQSATNDITRGNQRPSASATQQPEQQHHHITSSTEQEQIDNVRRLSLFSQHSDISRASPSTSRTHRLSRVPSTALLTQASSFVQSQSILHRAKHADDMYPTMAQSSIHAKLAHDVVRQMLAAATADEADGDATHDTAEKQSLLPMRHTIIDVGQVVSQLPQEDWSLHLQKSMRQSLDSYHIQFRWRVFMYEWTIHVLFLLAFPWILYAEGKHQLYNRLFVTSTSNITLFGAWMSHISWTVTIAIIIVYQLFDMGNVLPEELAIGIVCFVLRMAIIAIKYAYLPPATYADRFAGPVSTTDINESHTLGGWKKWSTRGIRLELDVASVKADVSIRDLYFQFSGYFSVLSNLMQRSFHLSREEMAELRIDPGAHAYYLHGHCNSGEHNNSGHPRSGDDHDDDGKRNVDIDNKSSNALCGGGGDGSGSGSGDGDGVAHDTVHKESTTVNGELFIIHSLLQCREMFHTLSEQNRTYHQCLCVIVALAAMWPFAWRVHEADGRVLSAFGDTPAQGFVTCSVWLLVVSQFAVHSALLIAGILDYNRRLWLSQRLSSMLTTHVSSWRSLSEGIHFLPPINPMSALNYSNWLALRRIVQNHGLSFFLRLQVYTTMWVLAMVVGVVAGLIALSTNPTSSRHRAFMLFMLIMTFLVVFIVSISVSLGSKLNSQFNEHEMILQQLRVSMAERIASTLRPAAAGKFFRRTQCNVGYVWLDAPDSPLPTGAIAVDGDAHHYSASVAARDPKLEAKRIAKAKLRLEEANDVVSMLHMVAHSVKSESFPVYLCGIIVDTNSVRILISVIGLLLGIAIRLFVLGNA